MVSGSTSGCSHPARTTLVSKAEREADVDSCTWDVPCRLPSASHRCSKTHEFAGNGAVAVKAEAALGFGKCLGFWSRGLVYLGRWFMQIGWQPLSEQRALWKWFPSSWNTLSSTETLVGKCSEIVWFSFSNFLKCQNIAFNLLCSNISLNLARCVIFHRLSLVLHPQKKPNKLSYWNNLAFPK